MPSVATSAVVHSEDDGLRGRVGGEPVGARERGHGSEDDDATAAPHRTGFDGVPASSPRR